MPHTLSITGKKATATVFASNLIIDNCDLIFLTAYGPTQEIRAFAQILLEGGNMIEVTSPDGSKDAKRANVAGKLSMIPQLDHGYTAMYVFPTGMKYIVGDSEEICAAVMARILDQGYFVHRDWYSEIRKLASELIPVVGDKKCLVMPDGIEAEVKERISKGLFRFPATTADLTVETEQDKKAKASA